MSDKVVRKLVAVLLIVVCPSTFLMAERPSAMLYATGAVTLNGIRIPAAKSMSLFAGDRVDTADASVVSINWSGSSLVVDPNSSVQYQSDGFSILKGRARVRMSKGMSAHAGPISVLLQSDIALFDVSTDGNTILVASREGTLTVTDGIETATLEPGFTAKVSLDSQDQGPKPAAGTTGDKKRRKKRLIIWIFASAAAGAAIACILACGGSSRTPISPEVP